MAEDRSGSVKRPLWLRLADGLLDGPLRRARWIYWPIWALGRGLSVLQTAWMLLANEYRKGSFGSCGTGVRIHGRFEVTSPNNLHIGDNVHINRNALIRAEGGVFIGDNTHIGRNLTVYSMNHDYQGALLPYDHKQVLKPVRIGRNVWIGINVSIAPGTRIGDGAIVAMGAVVSGEVAPGTIMAMPALRTIGARDLAHYEGLVSQGRYAGMAGYPRTAKSARAGDS